MAPIIKIGPTQARMTIGGSWRHGYIDGSIKELNKDDPKYSE